MLEKFKEELCIEEYSINSINLEEIVNKFSRENSKR